MPQKQSEIQLVEALAQVKATGLYTDEWVIDSRIDPELTKCMQDFRQPRQPQQPFEENGIEIYVPPLTEEEDPFGEYKYIKEHKKVIEVVEVVQTLTPQKLQPQQPAKVEVGCAGEGNTPEDVTNHKQEQLDLFAPERTRSPMPQQFQTDWNILRRQYEQINKKKSRPDVIDSTYKPLPTLPYP